MNALEAKLPHVSDAVRRLNAKHFTAPLALIEAAKKKRIRQSSKPLMNKLEERFYVLLTATYPDAKIRPQGKQYRIANGQQYRPDFSAIIEGVETCWETKGPKVFRGGFENLKSFKHEWPEVNLFMAWEENGKWVQQKILV